MDTITFGKMDGNKDGEGYAWQATNGGTKSLSFLTDVVASGHYVKFVFKGVARFWDSNVMVLLNAESKAYLQTTLVKALNGLLDISGEDFINTIHEELPNGLQGAMCDRPIAQIKFTSRQGEDTFSFKTSDDQTYYVDADENRVDKPVRAHKLFSRSCLLNSLYARTWTVTLYAMNRLLVAFEPSSRVASVQNPKSSDRYDVEITNHTMRLALFFSQSRMKQGADIPPFGKGFLQPRYLATGIKIIKKSMAPGSNSPYKANQPSVRGERRPIRWS